MSTQKNLKSNESQSQDVLTDSTKIRKKHALYFHDHPSLTKQEDVRSSNINNIMEQFVKTGTLPVNTQRQERYMDVSNLPSLENMHSEAIKARNSFLSLPLAIRQLCNHEPANLAKIIAKKEYADILVKHGILKPKEQNVQSDKEKAHDAPTNKEKSHDNGNQGTNSNSSI